MIQVQALQMFLHPREFRQTTVTDGPVWQQSRDSREDRQRLASTSGVGCQEGGDHRLSRILRPRTLLEFRQHLTEFVEGSGMIAVIGITDTRKGTFQRDGRHIKRTAEGGRHTLEHILNTTGLIVRTTRIQVDLQIWEGFQHSTDLQVLRTVDRSRCRDVVVHQQPTPIHRLVDIMIAHQSEGKVESWCHHSS